MTPNVSDAIARARRAVTTGRVLFQEGLVPECHEYMASALESLIGAWAATEAESDTEPTEPAQAALSALQRAGYRRTERLREALESTASLRSGKPSASSAAERDFDWVWAEVERLARFTSRYFAPPSARKKARWGAGVAVTAVVLIALLFALRLWRRPRVDASSSYSEAYPPAHAIDGLEATEWLLPDDTKGWLDLTLRSPRDLHSIRLINAHNVYYADRASRGVRVTAWSDNGTVASAEGTFPRLTQDRSVLDLSIQARAVTHVRVEVLSFFSRGGGLAEIELE